MRAWVAAGGGLDGCVGVAVGCVDDAAEGVSGGLQFGWGGDSRSRCNTGHVLGMSWSVTPFQMAFKPSARAYAWLTIKSLISTGLRGVLSNAI